MNAQITALVLGFLGDKIVPLALIGLGTWTYSFVSSEVGLSLIGAGLLAYQHKGSSPQSTASGDGK